MGGPWAEFAVTNAPAGLHLHAPSRPRGIADGAGMPGLVKQAAILARLLLAVVEHGNRFARRQRLRGDESQERAVGGVTVPKTGKNKHAPAGCFALHLRDDGPDLLQLAEIPGYRIYKIGRASCRERV